MENAAFAPFVICDEAKPAMAIPADFELVFSDDSTFEALRHDPTLQEGVGQHLAYSIARNSRDLFSHVYRIQFYFHDRNQEGLYSALLDLFLILQGKGIDLRTHLLLGSRSRMSSTHFASLQRILHTGVTETEVPVARYSVLSKGMSGDQSIVDEIVSDQDAGRDPLIEAREYIEYSQLEEARLLLEDAVTVHPQRHELLTELLHLYRAMRDQQHFHAMQMKLKHWFGELPPDWTAFSEDLNP
jgi:hypothetical protein